MKIKNTVFDYINWILLFLMSLAMIYPFLYVLFISISDRFAIASGMVKFYPRGLNIEAYKMLFKSDDLLISYYNSVRYSVIGTFIFIIITSIVAYPLSIKEFRINKVVTLYYLTTMFLSGGMIPTYILYRNFGLVNSMWVMVLPNALVVWYLVIFRTFFQSLGSELRQAAYIDGANDIYILFRIYLPLSKPLIATFSLFMIVGIWNDFFTPLLYLYDEKLQPLTIILRKLLIELDNKTIQRLMLEDLAEQRKELVPIEAFRNAAIIVTVLPIICIYPFIQKYFVKGIMIGSIKA